MESTYRCRECDGTFERIPGRGAMPHRCPPCRAVYARRRAREHQSRNGRAVKKPRPRGRALTCQRCGGEFRASRADAKWCSTTCRDDNPAAREKHRRANEAWREGNPDYFRQWSESNRDILRAHSRRRAAVRRHLLRTNGVGDVIDPRDVFECDGWICGLCGEPVDADLKWPDDLCATLDHIVPISRGGAHARENVQLAHWACNRSKGARASA